MGGTVVNRTMTAKLTHPSYSSYYPDITVGVLDSDVPETIAFARILPASYTTRIPALSHLRTLPTLCLDYEEKALVTDWFQENTSTLFITPQDAKRLEFYEPKIGGDSGNPSFIRINGQLVILTVWTYGGAGKGTSIRDQRTAINTMMASLGGGYQLTDVDLSGFPSY
jgi:hypothetical protein